MADLDDVSPEALDTENAICFEVNFSQNKIPDNTLQDRIIL